jgi:AcrR family transcriptional regulator
MAIVPRLAKSKPNPTPKVNRKAKILAETEKLFNEKGLSAVTTRAIAEAVGCSEGAIYVHFPNRLQLILTVLENALPEMLVPLKALADKVGTGTPKGNLLQAAKGLQAFHERAVPMVSSLFAEADLLQGFRETLLSHEKGPAGGIARIARYIQEEKRIGRIEESVDTDAVAAALMASSFFGAFTRALLGRSIIAASPARVIEILLR